MSNLQEQIDHLTAILKERDVQYPLKERSENGAYLFKRCYNCDEPLNHIGKSENNSSQIFNCTTKDCEILQITISSLVKDVY